jgi:hypothetical protein
MTREEAIQLLRDTLAKVRPDSSNPLHRQGAQIRDAKDAVLGRFRPVFTAENLVQLTAEVFREFLIFNNNHHWEGLQRMGPAMTEDMDRLRAALRLLGDEGQPIRGRLDRIRPPRREPMVKGLSRAVLTPILLVLYPDRYGVWNNISEAGMVTLGLWPEMPRGASFGERYERMNTVLLDVAREVGVDLWTLDMLWWRIVEGDSPEEPELNEKVESEQECATISAFGLEKHLHEFLVENWEKTTLGQDWVLLEEDGEMVGSHYQTGTVGEIDILAKHKTKNRWLVIELKRNQTSDETVGQLLRYMGWVRRKKTEGASVEGLIICHQVDQRLQYALDEQAHIRCMTYQVNFSLADAPELA